MTEASQLLAIARFSGASTNSSGEHQVTAGGDGLSVLEPPCDIWLHRPEPGLKNLLAPSSNGIGRGELFPARLDALRMVKGGARIKVGAPGGGVFADSLEGCWLCIPRSLLESDGALYRFQLIGLQIKETENGPVLGSVKDYFETGAHGIITIQTIADEPDILVPFIDEFTEVRLDQNMILIPNLRDFAP